MILSVSRRTDIPNYYSDWFYNRIKAEYLYVRNPLNIHQVSKIDLSVEVIDCIVFWTKNPEPMMERLTELERYKYYFQFTLTGYGKDMEANVPHKKEFMIPVFQKLSRRIGSEKVIWRYDPILFNETYTAEYHIQAFQQIARALNGYTKKCVISFVDLYVKNRKNMERMGVQMINGEALKIFAQQLKTIAQHNNMDIVTCAEKSDFADCGIGRSSCIDKALVESMIGCKIHAKKDRNQRSECGCVESIEVGSYHTCKNGCKYCYANDSTEKVKLNTAHYDVNSPLLCSTLTTEDKITSRKMKSLKEDQMSIFS